MSNAIFSRKSSLPSWGSRNPGVPDEEGGRIGQGVVGKHGDHASLRVFKRDAAVLGIDLHVHDVPRRVLLLGCGNVIVEGIETLAFGTAQDLLAPPPPRAPVGGRRPDAPTPRPIVGVC